MSMCDHEYELACMKAKMRILNDVLSEKKLPTYECSEESTLEQLQRDYQSAVTVFKEQSILGFNIPIVICVYLLSQMLFPELEFDLQEVANLKSNDELIQNYLGTIHDIKKKVFALDKSSIESPKDLELHDLLTKICSISVSLHTTMFTDIMAQITTINFYTSAMLDLC